MNMFDSFLLIDTSAKRCGSRNYLPKNVISIGVASEKKSLIRFSPFMSDVLRNFDSVSLYTSNLIKGEVYIVCFKDGKGCNALCFEHKANSESYYPVIRSQEFRKSLLDLLGKGGEVYEKRKVFRYRISENVSNNDDYATFKVLEEIK